MNQIPVYSGSGQVREFLWIFIASAAIWEDQYSKLHLLNIKKS
jgi:hypothetical protein